MEQWTKEEIVANINSEKKGAIYFYTPMCGTCQLAGRMLNVVKELLPNFPIGKADLNYMPELAETLEIESVPCLIIFENGDITQKIYAFQSVPFLYDALKS